MVVQRTIRASIAPAMVCAMNQMERATVTTISMALHVKRRDVRTTVQELWDEDIAMAKGKCSTTRDGQYLRLPSVCVGEKHGIFIIASVILSCFL